MITHNNKELRNLEEQVLFNSDRIDRILDTNVLLAQFGIKVIDQFDTLDELLENYPPESYAGDYGNAVLIGTEPPYDYYIWTRAFPSETSEQVRGEWFNIGEFPLPGPAGKDGNPGPRGPQGERGRSWFSGIGVPGDSITGAINGDLFFQTSPTFGAIYRYNGTVWQYQGNLRGADGQPGADGAQGPAGPIVDLLGTLTSVTQLPDNIPEFVAEYGRQAAYLVGAEGETKTVYGLTGPDDNLVWEALGLFAAGTQVFVNSQPVESIEMNQYVPKAVASETTYSVSAYNNSQNRYEGIGINPGASSGTLARRGSNGTLKANDPVESTDLATKNYVDQTIAGVVHTKYSHPFIITWREWIEVDPDTGEGYDETFLNEPFYIKLTPGMDFYLDVAFESWVTPFVCPYYKSGNNWYPMWSDNQSINSLTARPTYHFTVSQLDDGSIMLRTEAVNKDDYGQPSTTQVVIDGYDMTGQFSYGYNIINLKIGLDEDSYADMYNTILYTGNTQPTFSHEFIT